MTLGLVDLQKHVAVRIGGAVVADSHNSIVLVEPGLADRIYLPREDVRFDMLTPSQSSTTCPLKGKASYWNAVIDGTVYPDVVWSYETPIPDAERVAGYMCFYDEKEEVVMNVEGGKPYLTEKP